MSEGSRTQPASQIPPNPPTAVGSGGMPFGGSARVEFHPRKRIFLDLSAEAAQTLDELISESGEDPSILFRKAIGLYKLAKQATRDGKAVGIAATPDSLETEFVGL